jgi:hypothetical protein
LLAAGKFPEALDFARAATRGTEGIEEFEALALTGRLASWSSDLETATEALTALDAHRSWGRSAEASRHTLRASVAALRGGDKDSPEAEREWAAALDGWSELDLPLRLALCHLDRWLVAGLGDGQMAAAEIFERLGAAPLATLSH